MLPASPISACTPEKEAFMTKQKRKRGKGRLTWRFHRDYDCTVDHPKHDSLIVLRVFAPVKEVYPMFRFLILRKVFRFDEKTTSNKLVAMYTGKQRIDAVDMDDFDPVAFFDHMSKAKLELKDLQLRAEDTSPWYRGRQAEHVVANRLEVPEHIKEAVMSLTELDGPELEAAEAKLEPLFEEVEKVEEERGSPLLLRPFTSL